MCFLRLTSFILAEDVATYERQLLVNAETDEVDFGAGNFTGLATTHPLSNHYVQKPRILCRQVIFM